MLEPLNLTSTEEILRVLEEVALQGRGFTTDCLLMDVLDAGIIEPHSLYASGDDPDASYKGRSPAWAVYNIREGKNVFVVRGGTGLERTVHISVTP